MKASDETLGGLLERWRLMVAGQREDFYQRASQVSQWDMHLRRAHVDLHDLECSVEKLCSDSNNVNVHLDEADKTLSHMDEELTEVERSVEALLAKNGAVDFAHGSAQRARMGAYNAALELDAMLQHLEAQLASIEKDMQDEQLELSADPVRAASARARPPPPPPPPSQPPTLPTPARPLTTRPLTHPRTHAPHAAVRHAERSAPRGRQSTGAAGGNGARADEKRRRYRAIYG